MEAPLRAALARAREALEVVDSGRHYANFAAETVAAESIHGPRTLARLREVRASVDPTGRLHGNHPID